MEQAGKSPAVDQGKTPSPRASEWGLFSAIAAGWLIPGSGHVMIGKRVKGVLFFLIITACFGAGFAIGGPRIVSLADDRLAFAAQVMSGAAGIGFELYSVSVRTPLVVDESWELGKLYTCVAGLLNLLILLDLWSTRSRTKPAATTPKEPCPREGNG